MGHASATLDLNGAPIYVYPLGPDDARTFGFCHDLYKTAAQVRNVVLTGNWPTQLDAKTMGDLLAREPNQPNSPDASAVRRTTIGEAFFSRNASAILASAVGLSFAL